jgi:hypothetical protein
MSRQKRTLNQNEKQVLLDKIHQFVINYPRGIKISELGKRLEIKRTTLYGHLNILEGQKKLFYQRGIAYPYLKSQDDTAVSPEWVRLMWQDLDEIRKINASDNSFRAFRELRSLCKTWKPLYEKMKFSLTKTEKLLAELQKKGFDEPEPPQEGYVSFPCDTLKGLVVIENLIGEVSDFLHQQFARLS